MGKAHFKFVLKILVTVIVWCGVFFYSIVATDTFDFTREKPIMQELREREDDLKKIIQDKQIDEKEAKFIVEMEEEEEIVSVRSQDFMRILNEISEENMDISILQEQRYIKSVEKYVEAVRFTIYASRCLSVGTMTLLTVLMLQLFFVYSKGLKPSTPESEEEEAF